MNQIVVFAAHPDDETLGVGGTICRLVEEGNKVTVCFLTDGVRARHDHVEQQKGSARNACALLGADAVFFDFEDQMLDTYPLKKVVEPMTEEIQRLKPRTVFLNHPADVNQDHRVLFDAALIALRPIPNTPVREVYLYPVPSSTEWHGPETDKSFKPTRFVDIEKFLEKKVQAMKFYDETHMTELKAYPHPRSLEGIRIHAQYWGTRVGLSCAEPFEVFRLID